MAELSQEGGPTLRRIRPHRSGWAGRIQDVLESARFQQVITALISVNAVILGLETSPRAMDAAGSLLENLDRGLLWVFVLELLLKLAVYRSRFHHDPWNLFDFVVIGIAVVPASGSFSVLRALRILRALRLVSAVPAMRRVVGALLHAIPGMGSIAALLAVIFYVFSVMATKLFSEDFPEWFGSVGLSAYTLFQIMTLESWSMGIVRPVMQVHPYAWLFFIPFIVMTAFTVLNLFIGIIVDAMQNQHGVEKREETQAQSARFEQSHADRATILAELRSLRSEVQQLKRPDAQGAAGKP